MDEKSDREKPVQVAEEEPKKSGPIIDQNSLTILLVALGIIGYQFKLFPIEVAVALGALGLLSHAWDFLQEKIKNPSIKKLNPKELRLLIKEKMLEINIRFEMESFHLKPSAYSTEPYIYFIKGFSIEPSGVYLPCIVELGLIGREIEKWFYSKRYVETATGDFFGYNKSSASSAVTYTYITAPKKVNIQSHGEKTEEEDEK